VTNGRTLDPACGAFLRPYCVADRIEASGSYSVLAVGMYPSGSSMGCWAQSLDQFGNVVSSPGFKVMTIPNRNTVLPLGSVTFPPFGSLMTCCSMGVNATLYSVNF
jgi:hypothetical protein